jgi:hypothetical protein
MFLYARPHRAGVAVLFARCTGPMFGCLLAMAADGPVKTTPCP